MTEAKAPAISRTTKNVVANTQKTTFKAFINSNAVQESIQNTLGDAVKTRTLTANLISAVSTNPALRDCTPTSIISSALVGESLKLAPSPQLGHYYMVPFNDTKTRTTKATFILGWKGYYQLALRSGQYKKLNAVAVKEGEPVKIDPINEDFEFNFIENPAERKKAKTVGYYAYFELVNGFKKAVYWTKEEMQIHAETYSKGYKAHKGYTFWEKDFDSMALKTLYRQLISKYGIMSVEMQTAFMKDMTYSEELPTSKEELNTTETVYFDAEVNDLSDGEDNLADVESIAA